MIYFLNTFIVTFLTFSLFAQATPKLPSTTIVAAVHGDLDGDRKQELIVVYNMSDQYNDQNDTVDRILSIFKMDDKKWVEQNRFSTIIHASVENELHGDPFVRINIENQFIIIEHEGNSERSWNMKEWYKLTDSNLTLVEIEVKEIRDCIELIKLHVNLISGEGQFEKTTQRCSEETSAIILKKEIHNFSNYPKLTNIEQINVINRFKAILQNTPFKSK